MRAAGRDVDQREGVVAVVVAVRKRRGVAGEVLWPLVARTVFRMASVVHQMVVVRAAVRMEVRWARKVVRKVFRHLPVVEELVLGRSIVLVGSNGIGILERRKRGFGGWLLSLGWDRTL